MPEQLTVLVVDDDCEIVTAATLRLRAAGYRTRSAFDGESGLALTVECHPDIILLDVRMPRKDGLTALRELKNRSDTKDIPIVMLSASIIDQQAALDAGARFFLKKPYRGDILVQAVDAALACSADFDCDSLSLQANDSLFV
jgi:DNA-binding response OmpR family regulator